MTRYFDPTEDKWDRRMLFEVTGIRLDEDEFLESDTSDEEKSAKNREARSRNRQSRKPV